MPSGFGASAQFSRYQVALGNALAREIPLRNRSPTAGARTIETRQPLPIFLGCCALSGLVHGAQRLAARAGNGFARLELGGTLDDCAAVQADLHRDLAKLRRHLLEAPLEFE